MWTQTKGNTWQYYEIHWNTLTYSGRPLPLHSQDLHWINQNLNFAALHFTSFTFWYHIVHTHQYDSSRFSMVPRNAYPLLSNHIQSNPVYSCSIPALWLSLARDLRLDPARSTWRRSWQGSKDLHWINQSLNFAALHFTSFTFWHHIVHTHQYDSSRFSMVPRNAYPLLSNHIQSNPVYSCSIPALWLSLERDLRLDPARSTWRRSWQDMSATDTLETTKVAETDPIKSIPIPFWFHLVPILQ